MLNLKKLRRRIQDLEQSFGRGKRRLRGGPHLRELFQRLEEAQNDVQRFRFPTALERTGDFSKTLDQLGAPYCGPAAPFEARDWFVASHMTLADICLFAYTHVADQAGFDFIHYAKIRNWIERVKGQPHYVPMNA